MFSPWFCTKQGSWCQQQDRQDNTRVSRRRESHHKQHDEVSRGHIRSELNILGACENGI